MIDKKELEKEWKENSGSEKEIKLKKGRAIYRNSFNQSNKIFLFFIRIYYIKPLNHQQNCSGIFTYVFFHPFFFEFVAYRHSNRSKNNQFEANQTDQNYLAYFENWFAVSHWTLITLYRNVNRNCMCVYVQCTVYELTNI